MVGVSSHITASDHRHFGDYWTLYSNLEVEACAGYWLINKNMPQIIFQTLIFVVLPCPLVPYVQILFFSYIFSCK